MQRAPGRRCPSRRGRRGRASPAARRKPGRAPSAVPGERADGCRAVPSRSVRRPPRAVAFHVERHRRRRLPRTRQAGEGQFAHDPCAHHAPRPIDRRIGRCPHPVRVRRTQGNAHHRRARFVAGDVGPSRSGMFATTPPCRGGTSNDAGSPQRPPNSAPGQHAPRHRARFLARPPRRCARP